MSNVLVTGGLGFLGSHLVDILYQRGETITVVDNLSANVVSPAFCKGRCDFWNMDVIELRPTKPFDSIYHLASIVGPVGILPYGGILGYKIIVGMERIIALATNYDAAILFVSSSDVYGRGGWLNENDTATISARPTVRREYAIAKLLAEITTINTVKTRGLRANILRPFNISGPRQSEVGGFVIPRFIKAAIAGENLPIFEDGSQIRAFVHVKEVADACIMVNNSEINGEIYNVGNPQNDTRIDSLAQLIIKLCRSKSELRFQDPYDLYGNLYDGGASKLPIIDKIKTQIGWAPKASLAEILHDSIMSIKQRE